MATDNLRRFEKTPFALAGIPPAQPSRNAFAEQGMAQITHHLRGNAFAAQAISERDTSPPIDVHPALRQRRGSEGSLPPMRPGMLRSATPTLRDALELREAQLRAARDRADEANNSAIHTSSQTPSKKGVKDRLTNWRPFNRKGSKRDRIPRSSLPATFTPAPEAAVDNASVKSSIPPTPPAKNTPPAPLRPTNVSIATTSSSVATIQVAFPGRSDLLIFDEATTRRDPETDGFLPYFGTTHSRDHSPERSKTAPNLALFASSTDELETLSPDTYKRSSAAPSPLRVNGESVGTARTTNDTTPSPTARLARTPVLRHKTGSVKDFASPRVCSTIAEEPDRHSTNRNTDGASDSRTHSAVRGLGMADEIFHKVDQAKMIKKVESRFTELLDANMSTVVELLDENVAAISTLQDKLEKVSGESQQKQMMISQLEMKMKDVASLSDLEAALKQMSSDLAQHEAELKESMIDDIQASLKRTRSELKKHKDMSTVADVEAKLRDLNTGLKETVEGNNDNTIVGGESEHETAEASLQTGGDTEQEVHDIVSKYVEETKSWAEECKRSVDIHIDHISALNQRLDAYDIAADAGELKAKEFGQKVEKVAKSIISCSVDIQKNKERTEELYIAFERFRHSQTESMRKLRQEIADIKACHLAISEMYVRVASMTHMWANVTTGDLLQTQEATSAARRSRRREGKDKEAEQKTAATDPLSVATTTGSMDTNAPATANGSLPLWQTYNAPCNPGAFLDMMFSFQDRLAELEKQVGSPSKKPDRK